MRLENNGFFIQPKYPLIPLARELQKKNDTLCPLSKSAPALAISQPTKTIKHKKSINKKKECCKNRENVIFNNFTMNISDILRV